MSEIATGKLVIWMRLQAKRIIPAGNRTSIMLSAAADRLESQEQTIAGKDVEISTLKEKVEVLENDAINYDMNLSEMTARAESAERERDAAIADLKFLDRCKTCFHAKTRHLIGSECKTCKALSNFKWRGLPQEGEGKR